MSGAVSIDKRLYHPPMPWAADASCRGMDPDLFYPGRGDIHGLRAARAVCVDCPVREACLAHALDHGEVFGVWGGLSERERTRIRRARSRARRAA